MATRAKQRPNLKAIPMLRNESLYIGIDVAVNLLTSWEQICTFRGPAQHCIAMSKRPNLPRSEQIYTRVRTLNL